MAAAESAAEPLDFPSAFGAFADAAPADRGRGRPKGSSKQQRIRDTLVTYYALAGMVLARANPADGQLIVAKSVDMADAWVAAGKANPQIQKALEIVTVAGPYTALIMVHLQVLNGIMDHHHVSAMSLFKRTDTAAATGTTPAVEARGGDDASQQPAPLPYVPAGPHAPTDTKAPPLPVVAANDEQLRVWPDEGLPAELDILVREAARQQKRPYDEVRNEVMLELAQQRMAGNGHLVQPGALGAPVARE